MSGKSAIDQLIARLDHKEWGFAEAVMAAGIDARQLRNGLDRGSIRVGEKLRVGRWVFSLRDCFQLMILRDLTQQTWMPPSQAFEIARQIAPHAESIFKEVAGLASKHQNPPHSHFIIYAQDGGTKILRHIEGDGSGFFTLEGKKTEHRTLLDAHVKLPALGLVQRLVEFINLARVPGASAEEHVES